MDSKAFTNQLAKRLDADPKDMAEMTAAFATVIKECMRELDSVAIPGFGNFLTIKQPEQVQVDPASGKRMLLPPKIKLEFSPSAMFKKQVDHE